jgi:UPF0716 family protein affecting phage T7 exclusion
MGPNVRLGMILMVSVALGSICAHIGARYGVWWPVWLVVMSALTGLVMCDLEEKVG